jgi:hypothetical protein
VEDPGRIEVYVPTWIRNGRLGLRKEPPPVFTVNNNIVGYYYLPTATNPGAGQTPKNVAFFNHFDVWNYGTNFFNVEYLKATNGRVGC